MRASIAWVQYQMTVHPDFRICLGSVIIRYRSLEAALRPAACSILSSVHNIAAMATSTMRALVRFGTFIMAADMLWLLYSAWNRSPSSALESSWTHTILSYLRYSFDTLCFAVPITLVMFFGLPDKSRFDFISVRDFVRDLVRVGKIDNVPVILAVPVLLVLLHVVPLLLVLLLLDRGRMWETPISLGAAVTLVYILPRCLLPSW